MKNLYSALLIAGLASACLPPGGDSPIRMLGASALEFTPPGEACSAGELQLGSGTMDVAFTTSYVAQFEVQSVLTPVNTRVGSEQPSGPEAHDYYVDSIILTYRNGADGSVLVPTAASPVYFVLRAGSTFNMTTGLISDAARTVIAARTLPFTLLVDFQLSGKLQNGKAMVSTTATFPIEVLNSGRTVPTCVGAEELVLNGPCGNVGQDGSFPVCGGG